MSQSQCISQYTRRTLRSDRNSKYPASLRQYYVKKLFNTSINIYKNTGDASSRAADEERWCYNHCPTLDSYKQSCVLAIRNLKKEIGEKGGSCP